MHSNEVAKIVENLNEELQKMMVVFQAFKELQNIETNECIVCFESLKPEDEVVQLECNKEHVFHELCLKVWFKEKPQCPLCRTEIVKIKEIASELYQMKLFQNRSTHTMEDHI